MRRIALPLALITLAVALPATAFDPIDTDRRALLDHLAHSRALFTKSVAGLTPEQVAWKPAEDRWSVGEVAEHLAISEDVIRGMFSATLATEATAEQLEGAVKDDQVKTMIVDRSQKFEAPEQVRPASRWASLEAAMAHFEESRAKTVALVRDAGDLRAHAAEHPAFGNLDAIGWTYFLSGHTERHTLQIEEIKAAAGFPAG